MAARQVIMCGLEEYPLKVFMYCIYVFMYYYVKHLYTNWDINSVSTQSLRHYHAIKVVKGIEIHTCYSVCVHTFQTFSRREK